MKTKITLEVVGKTKSEIEASALSEISKLLDIAYTEVESKCDVELLIEKNSVSDYKATVYVRVK